MPYVTRKTIDIESTFVTFYLKIYKIRTTFFRKIIHVHVVRFTKNKLINQQV